MDFKIGFFLKKKKNDLYELCKKKKKKFIKCKFEKEIIII